MVFNRKPGFFLDLGSEGANPAKVAIKAPVPAAPKTTAAAPASIQLKLQASPAGSSPAPTADAAPASADLSGADLAGADQPTAGLTTAEAIAAELRAAQEALPPPILATFAPENLNPANAIPTRRRVAGANLAGFKGIARSLFGN